MYSKIYSKIIPKLGTHFTRQSSTVTALYNNHVALGAKIVDFGGFSLPLHYNDQGVIASHIHTRTNASLFDVSHMLQTEITGNNVLNYMETICTADIQSLPIGKSTLTLFTNDKGGILDDLIVTKISDNHLYVVSNAARKQHDKNLMLNAKYQFSNGHIDLQFFEPSERSLLALQGPKAAECLEAFRDKPDIIKNLPFMSSTVATVAGIKTCRITRCGYTGEDGFEISLTSSNAPELFNALLSFNNGNVVLPAGLAARDSLRIEAGLCLYGTDIDETTTPAEAVLMWLVAKRRRAQRDYPGAMTLEDIVKKGPTLKRVGLMSIGEGPPARKGTQIFSECDPQHPVGEVTSGCPSPSLGKNIAMGYISTQLSKVNTEVFYKIRNKFYKAIVTKMPFVKTNYYVKPK